MSGYARLSTSHFDSESATKGYGSSEVRDVDSQHMNATHYPSESKHVVVDDADHATMRKPRHRTLMTWWTEAVAVFLLVGSAIAIFATLYPYQGRDVSGRAVHSTINTTCLKPAEADLLHQAGYTWASNAAWLPYNSTGDDWVAVGYTVSPPYANVSKSDILALEQELPHRGCLYITDLFFQIGLSQVMNTDFVGNLSGSRSNDGDEMNYIFGPQILQTLYNYGDFGFNRTESLFENISISLTNHMRTIPESNVTGMYLPALGAQYTDKTCLVVAWRWLALPVALVVLTLVYLVGALFSLGDLSHGVRTWRGSPLPLLFHGPDLQMQMGQEKNHSQDIRDIERVTQGLRMRLVPDSNGVMYMQAST